MEIRMKDEDEDEEIRIKDEEFVKLSCWQKD